MTALKPLPTGTSKPGRPTSLEKPRAGLAQPGFLPPRPLSLRPRDLIGAVANETIASLGLYLMNSNLLESIEGRL